MEIDSIKIEENEILIDENGDDMDDRHETFSGDMLPISMR